GCLPPLPCISQSIVYRLSDEPPPQPFALLMPRLQVRAAFRLRPFLSDSIEAEPARHCRLQCAHPGPPCQRGVLSLQCTLWKWPVHFALRPCACTKNSLRLVAEDR